MKLYIYYKGRALVVMRDQMQKLELLYLLFTQYGNRYNIFRVPDSGIQDFGQLR